MKPIIVTGATGLIGKKIVTGLHKRNRDVIVFSRSPEKARTLLPYATEHVQWDAREEGAWMKYIDGAEGIINLAGTNVGEGRWTAQRKKEILDSRVIGTRGLVNGIQAAKNPPSVLVNASAVGYYGNTGDTIANENSPAASNFLAQVTKAWEEEAIKAEEKSRVVRARIGVVMDGKDGALGKLKLPFQLFIGGHLGSGKQWLSWIHRDDVIEMLLWSLLNPNVQGALNVVAPNPMTMKEWAKAVGKVMKRPSLFPVPEFALKLLLGEQHCIVTEGQRVSSEKAAALGYVWKFPDIRSCLQDLLHTA